ncbi:PREDICTED: growth factor receptor-bound protein 14-like [Calidris pugnax]|uniref:growth factor receptor-bound protein 14-like n=1 Tax=Calidris pugnax TaxID=198806 RepID=UPI00071DCAA6|nr:PREDICTED: growth factor receptor-bound protein 14-like [Calidris pugnax]
MKTVSIASMLEKNLSLELKFWLGCDFFGASVKTVKHDFVYIQRGRRWLPQGTGRCRGAQGTRKNLPAVRPGITRGQTRAPGPAGSLASRRAVRSAQRRKKKDDSILEIPAIPNPFPELCCSPFASVLPASLLPKATSRKKQGFKESERDLISFLSTSTSKSLCKPAMDKSNLLSVGKKK